MEQRHPELVLDWRSVVAKGKLSGHGDTIKALVVVVMCVCVCVSSMRRVFLSLST